ncbi:MAG: ABC transporter ATP-binding protein [Pseudomonadota bacterium]
MSEAFDITGQSDEKQKNKSDIETEAETSNAIQFDAVSKQYGKGPTVLQNIDLQIAKNDFIALIGPSGCGKSTLLKLLAGLTDITSGDIHFNGVEQGKKLAMGFVFQDANLMPWSTALNNVSLPLLLKGVNKAEAKSKAAELLEMVGLSHAVNQYPRQLSGGMKMRVSIARALSVDPQLLLLDEPFGALDEMTRDDLNEELLKLREDHGWTGVLVTHSVTESVFLSSKVLVMSANPGKIYKTIDVDFPFPRTSATRRLPEFQQKVLEVTEALHALRNAND